MFGIHSSAANTFAEEYTKKRLSKSKLAAINASSNSGSMRNSAASFSVSSLADESSSSFGGDNPASSVATPVWIGSTAQTDAIKEITNKLQEEKKVRVEASQLIGRTMTVAQARLDAGNETGAYLSMNKVLAYETEKETAEVKVEKLQELLHDLEISKHWIDYKGKLQKINHIDDGPLVNPGKKTREQVLAILHERLSSSAYN